MAVEIFKMIGNLGWPVAMLVVAIIYKPKIFEALGRLREVGPAGAKFGPEQQNIKDSELHEAAIVIRDFKGISTSTAVVNEQNEIIEILKRDENYKGASQEEKISYLVRIVAENRLMVHFERVYNIIFGSQIYFLDSIISGSNKSTDDAKNLFEYYRQNDADFYGDYKFEKWIGFLENMKLVEIKENSIVISPEGREFLLYITNRGLSRAKRG